MKFLRKKYLLGCIICFLFGNIAGLFLFNYLVSLIDSKKIFVVYVNISESLFLPAKIMILFGLVGTVIFYGTVIPKKLNSTYRFLLLFTPAFLTSTIVALANRSLLIKAVKISFGVAYYPNPITVTMNELKIELVPLTALLSALITLMLLVKKR